jgi:hypothetical protein
MRNRRSTLLRLPLLCAAAFFIVGLEIAVSHHLRTLPTPTPGDSGRSAMAEGVEAAPAPPSGPDASARRAAAAAAASAGRLVIVGSGIAGLSAALEASRAASGLEVMPGRAWSSAGGWLLATSRPSGTDCPCQRPPWAATDPRHLPAARRVGRCSSWKRMQPWAETARAPAAASTPSTPRPGTRLSSSPPTRCDREGACPSLSSSRDSRCVPGQTPAGSGLPFGWGAAAMDRACCWPGVGHP